MANSTITLHPIPAGASALTEGDQDDLLFRMEGGRVELSRNDVKIGTIGVGGVLGVAGVVLGTPQLFTATGADKASFAKKYVADSVEDLLAAEPELMGGMLAALEVELLLLETANAGRAGADRAPNVAVADAVARNVAQLASELAGGELAGSGTESLARMLGADPTGLGAGSLVALLGARATLRVTLGCRAVQACKDPVERVDTALQLLRERAQQVARACAGS